MTLGSCPKSNASTPWIPLELSLSYVQAVVSKISKRLQAFACVMAELRWPEVSRGYFTAAVDVR